MADQKLTLNSVSAEPLTDERRAEIKAAADALWDKTKRESIAIEAKARQERRDAQTLLDYMWPDELKALEKERLDRIAIAEAAEKQRIWNAAKRQNDAPSANRKLTLTSLEGTKMLNVMWLWQARVPCAMFGLFAGREGYGKSLIVAWLIAQVTRGTLDGDYKKQPRNVVICATEDSFAHTIVPRLFAAGADLRRVFRVDVREDDFDGSLNLPIDVPALQEQIIEREISLIVLDPLTSRLSDRLDTHKDADTRRALEPLTKLADLTGASVLGLIHLSKSNANTDPNNMIMGSRAFSAVARFTLMVTDDQEAENEDPTFILGQPKNSVGPSHNLPLLPYQIVSDTFPNDDGQTISTAKIKWLDADATRTFQDVMRPSSKRESPKDVAAAWLRSYLEGREGLTALTVDVNKAAQAEGHNERTVRRAADDMGVIRQGQGPKATWTLPEPRLL